MSTSTAAETPSKAIAARILSEGYGPGAWHGPDLKAALEDVSAEVAFWRPAAGRHNIAEIALHHAYCARSVRGKLSGTVAEQFVLEGDDWFDLPDGRRLSWERIRDIVDSEQQKLAVLVSEIASSKLQPSAADAEQMDLVLGITCHAVYHAGQVQLIKRLHG